MQTSCPADTGMGACTCQPHVPRSILATCTENRWHWRRKSHCLLLALKHLLLNTSARWQGVIHTTQPALRHFRSMFM